MHQIWISYFSRHFYEVNLILVLPQIHWTNFDEKKKTIVLYLVDILRGFKLK